MGRAQYAKGRIQLKVGRNNVCRRNAVILDPSLRVATLPYTKAATPRASEEPLTPRTSAPLTPRTSARLRAKIMDSLVGGNLPRGGFVAALAKEFNVCRNLPARILHRMRTRATGTADARVNNGRPQVYGDAYKQFIIRQVEIARNHKPRPFVATAHFIQAAMVKSTNPAITEIPTIGHITRMKKELGYKIKAVQKKPLLNKVMMRERVRFVKLMKKRFPTNESRESMLSLDEKVFGGEEPHFAFEYRPDIDVVPDHIAFMGEQAETRTQRPKTMALVCVSRNRKIGLWWLPMGKGRGKGVSSATLKPIWKQIRAKAKALKIEEPVLVYDRATVHTSKESQAELDRVFGKGNHEMQAPKSPDTNNGDAGLFPNGARATACSGATNKAQVERVVGKWWRTVNEKMLTAIDDRVLRNYERILELKGGNFYDESRVPNS